MLRGVGLNADVIRFPNSFRNRNRDGGDGCVARHSHFMIRNEIPKPNIGGLDRRMLDENGVQAKFAGDRLHLAVT